MPSKREHLWQKIFDGEEIPKNLDKRGWAIIDTKTIKEKYHAEPRLLAKVDAAEYLPQIFRQHDAAVLSLSNTQYAILRLGDKGKPLFPSLTTRHFWELSPQLISTQGLQTQLATIPWEKHFTSESQALDAAIASRILHDFVNEQDLALTIRGRRRFQGKVPLQFRVKGGIRIFPLHASGFQIEVDGGYESPQSVYLVEAKNRIQNSFNLRQVFFPYLFWTRYLRKRGVRKTVRPIFLLYTTHHYILSELKVEDEQTLNAISIRRQGWYILGDPPLTRAQIADLLLANQPQPILHTPFPQADRLLRIYSLLEEIQRAKNLSGDEIAEIQDFDRRQADYYGNAAKWLGWLDKEKHDFILTNEGRRLVQAPFAERAVLTFQTLARRPVFHKALSWWLQHKEIPSKEIIIPWIDQAVAEQKIKSVSKTTLGRRAQTVRGWLKILTPWVKQ